MYLTRNCKKNKDKLRKISNSYSSNRDNKYRENVKRYNSRVVMSKTQHNQYNRMKNNRYRHNNLKYSKKL